MDQITNKYFISFLELVHKKNGQVISKENDYISSHHKLIVLCQDNHKFEICLNNLKKDRWCPQCSTRKMERYTKQVAITILDKNFLKIRPDWLKNKEGNNLELDMYNDELKLAIEYNGIQHYKYCEFFHKSTEDFNKRVEDDKLKAELCKLNKIDLIVVPYTEKPKDFLLTEFNKRNLKLFNLDKDIIIKNELIEKLELIVNDKNGNILTKPTDIVTRNDTIQIRCHKGHTWETKVGKILSGSYCHTCGFEVSDETKLKISTKMKEYNQSVEGKLKKEQRDEPMSYDLIKKSIKKSIKYIELKTYKNYFKSSLTKTKEDIKEIKMKYRKKAKVYKE